jgi:hypothetical protein
MGAREICRTACPALGALAEALRDALADVNAQALTVHSRDTVSCRGGGHSESS